MTSDSGEGVVAVGGVGGWRWVQVGTVVMAHRINHNPDSKDFHLCCDGAPTYLCGTHSLTHWAHSLDGANRIFVFFQAGWVMRRPGRSSGLQLTGYPTNHPTTNSIIIALIRNKRNLGAFNPRSQLVLLPIRKKSLCITAERHAVVGSY